MFDHLLVRPISYWFVEHARIRLLAVRNHTKNFWLSGQICLRARSLSKLGPGQVWVLARVSVRESLRANEISLLVDKLESGLKQASENAARVDIVTADGS